MGETRVDLQHLLEDLRDAYTGALEETILTEIAANALAEGGEPPAPRAAGPSEPSAPRPYRAAVAPAMRPRSSVRSPRSPAVVVPRATACWCSSSCGRPDVELGRLVDSTIWINEAHPAYLRASASRSGGYHIALTVALALAPLAVGPAGEHASSRSSSPTGAARAASRAPGRGAGGSPRPT